MHSDHMKTLQVMRRVLELVGDAKDRPDIETSVGQLNEVLKRLKDFSISQDHAERRKRSLTETVRKTSSALRGDLLRPASLAAATVLPNDDASVESIKRAVTPPRSRTQYERLLVSARAMALAVDEHDAAFQAAGIPKDFATRIRSAADALEAALLERSTEEQRRMAATQGITTEARRGAALVKLISALIMPTLRSDTTKVAEWEKAIRVTRPPQKTDDDIGTDPTPAPTEGTPSSGTTNGTGTPADTPLKQAA